MFTLVTASPKETKSLGEKIAGLLRGGEILGFSGELGTGKTCLIQGICRGLGAKENVSSPTFTLINEYKGRFPIYHFDLYRLEKEEFFEIGVWEYFERGGVCLLEWAEKAEDLLPEDHMKIHLEYLDETSPENFLKRRIIISGREEILACL